MSDLQDRLLEHMAKNREAGGYGLSLDVLAARCGYKPAASGRLAVHKALRSLEAQGRAGYIRSRDDQWGVMLWSTR